MSSDGMGIFDLAERRLHWLDQRQGVLAQNIANANTPGYVGKDLTPFAQTLAQAQPTLALTNPAHIPGDGGAGPLDHTTRPSEVAPDGNAVSVEDQLTKVADTDGAQSLVTTLYHTYLTLFRTALDKA